MKIVLVGINAKYIHTNLAVRSLQANAGKYRNEVEIAEYTINHSIQEILSDLFDREPDVNSTEYEQPIYMPVGYHIFIVILVAANGKTSKLTSREYYLQY